MYYDADLTNISGRIVYRKGVANRDISPCFDVELVMVVRLPFLGYLDSCSAKRIALKLLEMERS